MLVQQMPTRKEVIKMMVCIEKLCNSNTVKTIGNHSVKNSLLGTAGIWQDSTGNRVAVKGNKVFTYHGNTICVVDDKDKKFYLSHAGWFTPSTKRALNDYRNHFESLGYKNVWNTKVYAYEMK